MDIRKKDRIMQGDKVIGNEVTVKVVKNKCAPPFKEKPLILFTPQVSLRKVL